jgi:hypothetical protein
VETLWELQISGDSAELKEITQAYQPVVLFEDNRSVYCCMKIALASDLTASLESDPPALPDSK